MAGPATKEKELSMIISRSVICAITLLFAITGCASKAPVRSAYSGADSVGAVSSDMFVGNWSVRVLNPIDGEQPGVSNVSYSADGTIVMNTNSSNQGFDMALRMTGSWQVEGDLVVQTLESIEETSGSNLGVLIKPLLAGMKDRATGSANVYEASANRIVLVSVEDGQAVEYTRII